MLPFLQPKKLTTTIMAKTKPEGGIEEMNEVSGDDMGLEAAASDLLAAIEAKDAKGIAEALKSAHDICSCGYDDEGSEGGV